MDRSLFVTRGCHSLSPVSRRSVLIVASKRQPKNPKEYATIDELRQSLHTSSGAQAGLSGFLNWVSEGAFGRGSSEGGFLALYRRLLGSEWAKELQSGVTTRPGYVTTPSDLQEQKGTDEADAIEVEESDLRVQQHAALLAWPSALVSCMAKHYPRVLELHPEVVIQRLLSLKKALPECDVSRLVEADPRLFFEGDQDVVDRQAAANFALLKEELPGADIPEVVQLRPSLLVLDLGPSIRRLQELWNVDSQVMRDTPPESLGLTLAALSDAGPPHKF